MPKIFFSATLAVFLSVVAAAGDDGRPGPGQTKLVVDAFPLQGPTKNLEPDVLDFRYQPDRWQACMGRPDAGSENAAARRLPVADGDEPQPRIAPWHGRCRRRYQVAIAGRSATIAVDPPKRLPAERLVVHLEHFAQPAAGVSLEGKRLGHEAAAISPDHPITVQVALPTRDP